MRNKYKLYSILLIGLVLLLASSVVLTSGCSHRTTEVGICEPLEPLPEETIPTRNDIVSYYDRLEVAPGKERPIVDVVVVEDSAYSFLGDNKTTCKRVFTAEGNVIRMMITIYENEIQAKEGFQERVELNSNFPSMSYSDHLEPSPDEALYYTFETDDWRYHGPSAEDWVCDGIIFRVGRYVGCYEVTEYDPPISQPEPTSLSASGIYYLSLYLKLMLQWAVETTIPELHSI